MWPGVAPSGLHPVALCARGSDADFSLVKRLLSKSHSDGKRYGSADDDRIGNAGSALENMARSKGSERLRLGNTSPGARIPVPISTNILPRLADIGLCEIVGMFFESPEYSAFSDELHNSMKDGDGLDLALCMFFRRMHDQLPSQRMHELCSSLHEALVTTNAFLCDRLPLAVSALASW